MKVISEPEVGIFMPVSKLYVMIGRKKVDATIMYVVLKGFSMSPELLLVEQP